MTLPVGQIICEDNLEVMRHWPADSVDLVYIDPPFFTQQERKGASQKLAYNDRFESINDYVLFLRPRCEQLVRLLKPTGTICVHLDWHASHYIKVMLDELLGLDSFINEVVWSYASGGRATHHFSRKHDLLLLYSPGFAKNNHTFNADAAGVARNRCELCDGELKKRNHMKRHVDDDGRVYRTIKSNGKVYRYYDDETMTPGDVWHMSHLQQKDPQRTGYPTQKPLALLSRIIEVCSNPADVVLDVFSGSGTTVVAAEQLGRNWIGVDESQDACAIAKKRIDEVKAKRVNAT